MKTKAAIKNENIAAFGGIFHVLDSIQSSGVAKVIDAVLGKRRSKEAFKYSEIFSALCATYMCDGDCLEDIEHIHKKLEAAPDVRIAIPDTNGRVLKSLSTENLHYKSTSGNVYDVNDNSRLNGLLLHLLFTTGQLKLGQQVDVDFDHQFIEGGKHDAKWGYKGGYGYFPGVATIGNMIVGFETAPSPHNNPGIAVSHILPHWLGWGELITVHQPWHPDSPFPAFWHSPNSPQTECDTVKFLGCRFEGINHF